MLPSALKQEEGPTSALNTPQKGISLAQQQNKPANQQVNGALKATELDKTKNQVKKEKQPSYIEQLWRALIRPPNRINYRPQQLGPTSFVLDKTVIVKREDFKVKNSRGLNLECSYFEPIQIANKPHPCILYLHGNSSSRNEGIVLVQYLVPYGISLVLMDFSGCGISEGEFISLGYYEKFDAKQVMDHVKKWKPITEFGLWGRSMGAATTLMTSLQEDLSIRFIVVDSSFISIKQLCEEIARNSYKVPKFILSWAYQYIRGKVKGLAKFDLDDCDALKAVQNPKNKPNALFLVAKGDTLISPSHSQKLFNLYRGSKRILMFEGTHNSRRPKEINQEITKFFFNGLFDDYAMKQLKAFKMVPSLPNFHKPEVLPHPMSHIKSNPPPPVGHNSNISVQNPSIVNQKSINENSNNTAPSNAAINIRPETNHLISIANIQNKIRYEASGQLIQKNVEKDDVLQEEDEEDMTSIPQKEPNKNIQMINQISNHNSQAAQQPKINQKLYQTTPKSNIAEPSLQGEIDFNSNNLNQLKFKRDSFLKIAPSEAQQENGNQTNKANSVYSNTNTINHNYNIYPHGPSVNIPSYQLSNVCNSIQNDDAGSGVYGEKTIDRNGRIGNNQIHFSNFRQVNQPQNQYDDNVMKEESMKDQNDQERQSEDSKVYSVNIPNLPSQNFQVNMNTEGQEQSPRQPKSQYNFDSNNILINFQRYGNTNGNNLINGGIMNNGSILQQNTHKNQDIKEEEDTQFNSKIDRLDQEIVNQNIGLSGFYIPPDHGSQVHQSGVQQNTQMVSSIMNRIASVSPQHQNASQGQNERVPYPVIQHTNSQYGIASNAPLDNTMTIASPDKCPSPQIVGFFNENRPTPPPTNQNGTQSSFQIINANAIISQQQSQTIQHQQPQNQQQQQQQQQSIFQLQKVLQFQ